METKSAWQKYTGAQIAQLEALSARYIKFISANKTERECAAAAIEAARDAGYISLKEARANTRPLAPGDKVYADMQGKAVILAHIGKGGVDAGFNILGAHIDSPRLDIKQNPLYEKDGFALLDTHYYGGIKKYQWVALPLALHGVVAKKSGEVIPVAIGDDPADPVFCISDLLPHLGAKQMEKKATEVVEGEALDLIIGNRPTQKNPSEDGEGGEGSEGGRQVPGDEYFAQSANYTSSAPAASFVNVAQTENAPVSATNSPASVVQATASTATQSPGDEYFAQSANCSSPSPAPEPDKTDTPPSQKDAVRGVVLQILSDKYGIDEADFLSAELEVVPAGPAREAGLDRSMVLGYGQDDRVCAYASLEAQLALAGAEPPARTALCVLVDKEEIGSVGASGMESAFFENMIFELAAMCAPAGAPGEAGDAGNANLPAASDITLRVRRALAASRMLSSDVSAGVDPAYDSVFESKNSAYLSHGLVFNKYTGARGKSGSNDARAEYMAQIRRIMDDAGVTFQTAELGRVDAGGGGTIAYIPARFGMDVIDSGVPVLSMHSPWELTSKADIYEAAQGYHAFLLSE